ncbi:MAG: hypothetical protein H7222_06665 [Methylotenera sp.]|nr:hypothetical protein [Oligoflexia bacterium]
MMKLVLLLGMVSSVMVANAFADGDRLQVLANCYSDDSSEGGYRVVVHSGGFTGLTTAKIEESTFAGNQELQTLEVKSSQTGRRLSFADAPTRGEDFQLLIDLQGGNGLLKIYPAKFKASTQLGRISGKLFCSLKQFEL